MHLIMFAASLALSSSSIVSLAGDDGEANSYDAGQLRWYGRRVVFSLRTEYPANRSQRFRDSVDRLTIDCDARAIQWSGSTATEVGGDIAMTSAEPPKFRSIRPGSFNDRLRVSVCQRDK
jgi:hypothetical protein